MLFADSPSNTLLTPSLGVGLYGHNNNNNNTHSKNPFSPDFHLFSDTDHNNNNNHHHEQNFPKFHQQHQKVNDNKNENDKFSQLLFSDVEFSHAQDFVDSDTEKSDLFSSYANSPSLDVDSFCSNFDEEATNCDIGTMDIEKWLTQAAFPSPPMDINSNKQDSEHEEDPPWMGEECTIGSSRSSSSFFEDTQTNISSASSTSSSSPTTPTDGLAPSSPTPAAVKKTTTKKKRGATLTTCERKLRKKHQNKTAAEKYRVKKKSEKMTVQERHAQMVNANKELKLQLENMDYRVTQLKQLFLDILHMPMENKTT